MQRVMVFVVLLAGMASNVQAQEYRLREPSAEEYLMHVVETFDEYEAGDAKNLEIQARYSNLQDQDTKLIFDAYFSLYEVRVQLAGRDWWNQQIILAWLNENSINLNDETELKFSQIIPGYDDEIEYEIEVTPHDFNADGDPEWWLIATDQSLYFQYLIIDGEPGNYHLVKSPLPWSGFGFGYWEEQSGAIKSLGFKDVNADDIPEWILVTGCIGGNYKHHGALYILSWQNDELVDLAPEGRGEGTLSYAESDYDDCIPPHSVRWNFVNLDNDSALEIQQRQEVSSYRWAGKGRPYDGVEIFDWDSTSNRYVYTGREYDHCEISAWCSAQAGHEALWNNDYEAAIPFFERSLELFSQIGFSPSERLESSWINEYIDYTSVRLALAYSVVGRDADAAAVIETLEEHNGEYTAGLVTAVQQAYENDPSARSLCFTLYNYFNDYYLFGSFTNMWAQEIPYPLERFEVPPRDVVERSGCDAPGLVLSSNKFPLGESVVSRIKASGLRIRSTTTADLNNDGYYEWLIEYSPLQVPILFIADPESNSYKPIRPNIGSPVGINDIFLWSIPEINSPILVVSTSPWVGAFSSIEVAPPCNDQIPEDYGWIELWSLDEETLTMRQAFPSCGAYDPFRIFPDGVGSIELRAYRERNLYKGDYVELATTYMWDSETQQYIYFDSGEVIDPTMQDVWGAFEVRDYGAALRIVDALIKSPPEDSEEAGSEFERRYWRALTLEMLNRPDEALADYVTIYETTPNSSWGRLAALHFTE